MAPISEDFPEVAYANTAGMFAGQAGANLQFGPDPVPLPPAEMARLADAERLGARRG